MSSPSVGQPPANTLLDRYQKIKERIRQAAEKSGRKDAVVSLMAVTKTVGPERIGEALKLGLKCVGENRVQEAAEKIPALRSASKEVEFHLIGSLQTNKARKAVELFDVVQSVDRPRLAETLDRIAGELGKKQRCLIEVKISNEATKSGIPLAEAEGFVQNFSSYKNLVLEGLMTIGQVDSSEQETRQSFQRLARFFEQHQSSFGSNPVLSMGMSDDFEIAIEEGSTMVRIGRALFGERS